MPNVLVFRHDTDFGWGMTNVEGLSLRTILLNCFCQVQLKFFISMGTCSQVLVGPIPSPA